MSIYITPSVPEHAQYLADNMREDDVTEIKLSHGFTPLHAIQEGIEHSDECYTVMVHGDPALIFGVKTRTIVSTEAVIWMLSTELINKIGFRFVKHSKKVVDNFNKRYTKLHNFVWVGNTISIAWLKWLGFTLSDPAPSGVEGAMFQYFEMRN